MENLGIDWKLIISQVLNFAVFFFIFFRFIAKPFREYLARQKQLEQEREELAANIKKQQDDLVAEQESIKETMKQELTAALAKAKEEGKIAREEAIKKAEAEAEGIVKKAHEQIEHDRAQMESEMKTRIADLTTLLITKGMREYLDDDARRDLTKFILEKVSKEEIKYEN
jgi:F-type H+-transporting ATPase subunit b